MTDSNRRRVILSIAGALATPFLIRPAAAQALVRWPGEVTSGLQATVTRVSTTRPVVAMTFDDGPHPTLTPQLLDILAARNIRATFFVIGNRAVQHPQLLQRMAAEGHEIGNHTWRHPYLTSLGNTSLLSELDRTNQAVFNAVGRPPVTMRPPYGALSNRQRLLIHQERNLPTVLWSVDPEDWRRPGSSVVASRIVRNANSGAVILAHDIHGATVRAMPAALDGLIARGFSFVSVSELLGWPRWNTRHIQLAQASG